MKIIRIVSILSLLFSLSAKAEAVDLMTQLHEAKQVVKALPASDVRYTDKQEKTLRDFYKLLAKANDQFIKEEDPVLLDLMVELASNCLKKDASSDSVYKIFPSYKKNPDAFNNSIKRLSPKDAATMKKVVQGLINDDEGTGNG